jgi:hypothetical protein
MRDGHSGYTAAKAGDVNCALALALELISKEAVDKLRSLIGGRRPPLLPVIADETTGFNAIPDAMAQVLSRTLGLDVIEGEIVQTNKVGNTRAPAFQRIVTPATFDGDVQHGALYLLVDDHVGLGGTLANLRGYVEARGGRVIAITTLTESRNAQRRQRHDEELDQLWRNQFGYGLDCLAEVEGQNLCRQQSVAAIEDFLAQAAIEARGRGLQPAIDD